jgi:hypothetical protein
MDDQTRNELLARLTKARKLEAAAQHELRDHGAKIEQVRNELGNPYFYSGRSADDPESEAKFTGWKSHEPAFRLWQQWQDVSREIKAIRRQLHDAGIEAE